MDRKEIVKKRIEEIINSDKELMFPATLLKLREAHGIRRTEVCRNLDLPYVKLFNAERGGFFVPHEEAFLKKLAEYYNVDVEMLRRREKEFLKFIARRRYG